MKTATIITRPLTTSELAELTDVPARGLQRLLDDIGIRPMLRVGRSRIRCYSPADSKRIVEAADVAKGVSA